MDTKVELFRFRDRTIPSRRELAEREKDRIFEEQLRRILKAESATKAAWEETNA